jgi:hypothetical protein
VTWSENDLYALPFTTNSLNGLKPHGLLSGMNATEGYNGSGIIDPWKEVASKLATRNCLADLRSRVVLCVPGDMNNLRANSEFTVAIGLHLRSDAYG